MRLIDRNPILRKALRLDRAVPRDLYRTRGRLARAVQWTLGDACRALRGALRGGVTDPAQLEPLCDRVDTLAKAHLQATGREELRDYLGTLALALVLALLIRTFAFAAFQIPSGSMIPTLEVGDHIFVSKFVYGLPIPWSDKRLFAWRRPRRGEVIVFRNPEPGKDYQKDFIKRVIAVGGDRVRLDGNRVVVNGHVDPESHVIARRAPCQLEPGVTVAWRGRVDESRARQILDPRAPWAEGVCPCTYVQEHAEGQYYVTQHVSPNVVCQTVEPPSDGLARPTEGEVINQADWPAMGDRGRFLRGWGRAGDGPACQVTSEDGIPEMWVPDGFVFVMGDNRDQSDDSRGWGLVPLENVRGKALLIWWATQDRWGRFLRRVH